MTSLIDDNQTGFQVIQSFGLDRFVEYCFKFHNKGTLVVYKAEVTRVLNKVDKHTMIDNDEYTVVLLYSNKQYKVNYITKSPKANVFKLWNNFVNEYNKYAQTIYTYNGIKINTIIHEDKVWFDLYQISDLLDYASSGYLQSYYRRYSIASYGRYTDKDGLREVLNRGRKPGCKPMLQQLDLNSSNKIQSPEANVLEYIIDYLDDEFKLQYPCGSYRIDMYIPKYKIAIEVDEMGHADRDPTYECKREEYIKTNLTDKILRINPNAPNFRIVKELGSLARLMC
jgi:very-short-patch-repair endonuclease